MKPEVGEICFGDRRISFTVARSRRRRRTIGFVMENPTTLKITAPVRASLSSICSVLKKQTGWIARRLAELQKAAVAPTRHYGDGESINYLGHAYRLCVTQDKDLPQGVRLKPHRMIINLHPDEVKPIAGWLTTPSALREEARLEILLWMKKRAKAKFQKRMNMWAGRLGVTYRKLVIANAERRWGSCNAQNVIRLNWRLIMAPLPILDYVVVHELCHVRHKNHGPKFWGQVASVMPDWKTHRKHLRVIGDGLLV